MLIDRVNLMLDAFDDPYVAPGNEVDHYLSDHADEDLAMQCILDDLPELLPSCRATLDAICE